MFSQLNRRLKRAHPAVIFLISGLAIAALVWIDYKAPPEVDLVPFFFIPVLFAAWYSGFGSGLFFAVASVVGASLLHYQDSPQFWTPPRIGWGAATRLASLALLAWMCARLRGVGDRENEVRKEAQDAAARLKASMKMLMGREIAGAVTVLETALDMMRARADSGAQQWDDVVEVLNRMKAASRRFIDETRMQSARISEKLEKVELQAVIFDAVSMFEPLARRVPMNFAIDVPTSSRRVWADRAALSLVLSTLLGRTIRSSPPEGRVVVKVDFSADGGGRARVTIGPQGGRDGALPAGDRALVQDLLRLHNSELEAADGRASFTLTEASEIL